MNLNLILRILLIVFIFSGITILFVRAESTTGDSITTTVREEVDGAPVNFERIYEVSPSILDRGYKTRIKSKDAFRIGVANSNFYLVFREVLEDQIDIEFFNGESLSISKGYSEPIDLNGDGTFDIFVSVISITNNEADIEIGKYGKDPNLKNDEKDYKELFDVEVGLMNDHLHDSKDLTVFMKFVNFGEGLSHIEIVYSIFNSEHIEVYKGVEEKVVYTEESLIKEFDFLDLPAGNYSIYSKIYYGENQTADSEEFFEILEKKPYNSILNIVIALLVLTGFYFFIYFINKKRSEDNFQTSLENEGKNGR